jgi:tetratricopeptide (TPR) repeat protein
MHDSSSSLRVWVISSVIFLPLFFWYMWGFTPGTQWVIFGAVAFAMTAAFVSYLARPTVWQTLAFMRTQYRAHRARISGNFAAEEKLCKLAVEQAEESVRNRDYRLGTALARLGEVYRTQGRLSKAEPLFLNAIAHCESAAARGPLATLAKRNAIVATTNLVGLYLNQGRLGEAERHCDAVDAAFSSDRSAGKLHKAVALYNRGQVLAGRGRLDEAESLTREALALIGPMGAVDKASLAIVLAGLAEICRRLGRLDEAMPLGRQAVEEGEKSVFGPQHPLQTRFLSVLAEILRMQGRVDEAEKMCTRAQELTENAFGSDHFRLDGCLATLARIRVTQGQQEAAAELLHRCVGLLEKAGVSTHPDLVARRAEYAQVLQALGQNHEAAQQERLMQPTPVLEPAGQ